MLNVRLTVCSVSEFKIRSLIKNPFWRAKVIRVIHSIENHRYVHFHDVTDGVRKIEIVSFTGQWSSFLRPKDRIICAPNIAYLKDRIHYALKKVSFTLKEWYTFKCTIFFQAFDRSLCQNDRTVRFVCLSSLIVNQDCMQFARERIVILLKFKRKIFKICYDKGFQAPKGFFQKIINIIKNW